MSHRSRRAAVAIAFVLCSVGLSAQGLRHVVQVRSPALPPLAPNGAPEMEGVGNVFDGSIRLRDDRGRSLRYLMTAEPQASPSQKPPEGFEEISGVPPSEQLPAAPMLVAAYIFVMLAFFAYVLSVARRLGAVKQDIARLESEIRRSGQR